MGGSVRTARVRLGRHGRPRARARALRAGDRGSPAPGRARCRPPSCRCSSAPPAWRARATSALRGRSRRASWRSALQVGTNFANDYSDGVRGTDDPGRRVGPVRLVGWGIQPPGAVKRAALLSFGVAVVAGLGAGGRGRAPSCSWSAPRRSRPGWFYTGGSHPYGYYGFGELFVFTFFGVVATAGSAYVQTDELAGAAAGRFGPGRALGDRAARDQQPPRHPRRHRVGQAHPRRAHRRRPHPLALRRHARGRVRAASRSWPAASTARRAAAALVGVVLARQPVLQVLEGAAGPALIPVLGRHRPRPARERHPPRRRPLAQRLSEQLAVCRCDCQVTRHYL